MGEDVFDGLGFQDECRELELFQFAEDLRPQEFSRS